MPYTKNFVPGDVFWINVVNRTMNDEPSCAFPTCNILVDFASPNRY